MGGPLEFALFSARRTCTVNLLRSAKVAGACMALDFRPRRAYVVQSSVSLANVAELSHSYVQRCCAMKNFLIISFWFHSIFLLGILWLFDSSWTIFVSNMTVFR